MSERRRRPGEQDRQGTGMAGAHQLMLPQRGDPALEAESGRLAAMAAGRGGRTGLPPIPPEAGGEPARVPGGGTGLPPIPPEAGGDPGMRIQYPMGAKTPASPSTMEIPAESAVRTDSEEEAYNLGQKMGAASIAGQLGTPLREQPRYIDENRLIEAERLLNEYKKGKASVDRRIINAQDWWKMRNWDQIENERGTMGATQNKSVTGWLWHCILGKHAEGMDAYPEPVILPRMEEDKAEAEMLSDIVPVVLKNNGFEKVYSDALWQKFQEGTAGYYVGWDKAKLGGIGDVAIRNINLLNLYWEPGIEDIQESENLFYVNIVNTKQLEEQYPRLKGKLTNAWLRPNEYRKDDSVSMDGKSVLVDWYYHVWQGNRKVLHYCQFVGHEVIYSTENNGETEGLYADGEYPFVLDVLYPVHGSPAGYGLIDCGKDVQGDIDTLNQAMVLNAVVTSTPRWFIQGDGPINEEEYADWSKPFVHTNGALGDNNIRQIITQGIQGSALQMLQNKIEELKSITGNTEIQTGGNPSGVTAASAIAALQEAHGRSSKDSSRGSYRCFDTITTMVIERIRQFYDIPRQFRILGPNGQQKFVTYSNVHLKEQQMLGGLGLEPGLRKPVFDIEVRSERETSYTKMSQNELAVQFMQLGVFNPQLTDQTLLMLDMMDFRGKEELMHKVEQTGTLQQALLQIGQIALALGNKYDPAVAQQLAPILQSIGMDTGMIPAGGVQPVQDIDKTGEPSDANAIVSRARERSQDATRPE